jgi:hypothetical protein
MAAHRNMTVNLCTTDHHDGMHKAAQNRLGFSLTGCMGGWHPIHVTLGALGWPGLTHNMLQALGPQAPCRIKVYQQHVQEPEEMRLTRGTDAQAACSAMWQRQSHCLSLTVSVCCTTPTFERYEVRTTPRADHVASGPGRLLKL